MQTVQIFISDIWMHCGTCKHAMLERKRGKVVQNEGIELPDGEKIKSLENEKG